jgi:hypothetical protein
MSNGAEAALLREQHEAMSDIMMLRRISVTAEQREISEHAIAVWHKVRQHLEASQQSNFDPRKHPGECSYHVDQYPHECTCGAIVTQGRDAQQGSLRSTPERRCEDTASPNPLIPTP